MWYAICLGIGMGGGLAIGLLYGGKIKREMREIMADYKDIINILSHDRED